MEIEGLLLQLISADMDTIHTVRKVMRVGANSCYVLLSGYEMTYIYHTALLVGDCTVLQCTMVRFRPVLRLT